MGFLNFFKKSGVTVTQPEGPAEQVATLQRDYKASEAKWSAAQRAVIQYRRGDAVSVINGAALVHVNTLKNEDPELTRLCRIEQAAKADRNEKLRAMLRAQGKLS